MGRCLLGHEPMHAQVFEVPFDDFDFAHEALAEALTRAAAFIKGGVREDGANFCVDALTTNIDIDIEYASVTVIYNVFGEVDVRAGDRDRARVLREIAAELDAL